MASDGLHETEVPVVIHVNDLNDNPPVFTQNSYEATIMEETLGRNGEPLKLLTVTVGGRTASQEFEGPSICEATVDRI